MIMKNYFLGVLILISAQCFAQESVIVRDLQTWTSVGVKKRINKELDFSLSQELRLWQNSGKLDNTFTELGFKYSPIKRLSFGLGYRYILDRDADDLRIEHVRRWNLDIGYNYKFDRFKVFSRFRYQNKADFTKYADDNDYAVNNLRLLVGTKYNIKGSKITPYFTIEIYRRYEKLQDSRFGKFRLTTGASLNMKGIGKMKVYYRYQKELGVNFPETTYIIGLNYFFNWK